MKAKNITLSVDEAILRTVRRYASGHDTTVNGLVREYLTLVAQREDNAANALSRIRELSNRSTARTGKKAWDRDDLHDR